MAPLHVATLTVQRELPNNLRCSLLLMSPLSLLVLVWINLLILMTIFLIQTSPHA